jgi:pyruvate,water dikinase
LDELRIHDAASVGDDAATLGELVAGGVQVADGFVLSAAVLRRMLINVGVDPGQLREDDVREAAWLQARLLDGPIDPCAVAQLIAAYRHLGARTGLLDPAVALRASVLGERAGIDRGWRPTAVGAPAMIDGVRAVWSSLFDASFLADRLALRIAGAPSAAVLIQQAVPMARSGSAFTRDPFHPTDDLVFVEAAFGSGPDVWTGPPSDEYRLDRSTHEVVQTRISVKEAEVVLAGGQAAPVATPPGRHPRVLTDDEAASVTRTVLAVEDVLGGPQIVQWGVTPAGEVLVRTARPLDVLGWG